MQTIWQRVYDTPDDDAPRRVLADALMERGDPRGELISIQCHLAMHPEDEWGPRELDLQKRESALLDAHGDAWTKDWPLDLRPVFLRGFPTRQMALANDVATHLAEARAQHPTLTEVVLVDEDPIRWRLPPLPGIRRLTLPITVRPDDPLDTLDVEALTFTGGTLMQAGAHQLATLTRLRELDFDFDVGMGGAGFAALASLQLTRFVNRGNAMGDLPPQWPALTRLTLDRVEWRVQPSFWPKLERLELFQTRLGRRGVHAVLDAGHPTVTRLGIRGERIDADAIALLERWPRLEVLDLTGCTFGPGARQAFAESPVVKRLRCSIPR